MSNLLDKTYSLAEDIQKLAPWNSYEDTDLIYMEFTTEDSKSVYASIMGNAQQVYGISFYEGEEGLGVYLDMATSDDDSELNRAYRALSMKCLTVYYDPVNDIKNGPFFRMLDKRYKNSKGAVPYFVRLNSPYLPYEVENEDLKNLYRYLRGLKLVLEKVDDEGFSYDAEKEILTSYIDDEDEEDIDCDLMTMPVPTMSTRYFDIPYDKKRLERVFSKADRTDHLLIIDCDYYGPFEDDSFDKPFYADMLFFFNEEGMIVDAEMLKPTDHKFEIVVDKLCRYVETFGIPDSIAVRKPDLEYLIGEIADKYDFMVADIEWDILDEDLNDIREHFDQFSFE